MDNQNVMTDEDLSFTICALVESIVTDPEGNGIDLATYTMVTEDGVNPNQINEASIKDPKTVKLLKKQMRSVRKWQTMLGIIKKLNMLLSLTGAVGISAATVNNGGRIEASKFSTATNINNGQVTKVNTLAHGSGITTDAAKTIAGAVVLPLVAMAVNGLISRIQESMAKSESIKIQAIKPAVEDSIKVYRAKANDAKTSPEEKAQYEKMIKQLTKLLANVEKTQAKVTKEDVEIDMTDEDIDDFVTLAENILNYPEANGITEELMIVTEEVNPNQVNEASLKDPASVKLLKKQIKAINRWQTALKIVSKLTKLLAVAGTAAGAANVAASSDTMLTKDTVSHTASSINQGAADKAAMVAKVTGSAKAAYKASSFDNKLTTTDIKSAGSEVIGVSDKGLKNIAIVAVIGILTVAVSVLVNRIRESMAKKGAVELKAIKPEIEKNISIYKKKMNDPNVTDSQKAQFQNMITQLQGILDQVSKFEKKTGKSVSTESLEELELNELADMIMESTDADPFGMNNNITFISESMIIEEGVNIQSVKAEDLQDPVTVKILKKQLKGMKKWRSVMNIISKLNKLLALATGAGVAAAKANEDTLGKAGVGLAFSGNPEDRAAAKMINKHFTTKTDINFGAASGNKLGVGVDFRGEMKEGSFKTGVLVALILLAIGVLSGIAKRMIANKELSELPGLSKEIDKSLAMYKQKLSNANTQAEKDQYQKLIDQMMSLKKMVDKDAAKLS